MIFILTINGHEVVRQGLSYLLEHQQDMLIVGEDADGEQVLTSENACLSMPVTCRH